MALQSSGAIKLSEIQTEFTGSNPISMSEYYRGGVYVTSNNTGVPTSGAISISQFYGTRREFAFTIASNQVNANLRTLAINAGWDEVSPVVATIASGIYASSNNTGTPALTVNGSFPTGIKLINNGFIVGMGGAGGRGARIIPSDPIGTNGFNGGLALFVSSAIAIQNNGIIGGGGGGGGGGQSGSNDGAGASGGGGGGGGRSGTVNSAGGGAGYGVFAPSPGAPGTSSSAGNGGAGGNWSGYYTGFGGNGGNWGQAGSNGTARNTLQFPTVGEGGYNGGAAGAAVSGNSFVTWLVTGTRYGSVG